MADWQSRARDLAIALVAAMLGDAHAHAQDAISSDRPGFSTGPGTVAQGQLQVEAGAQYDDGADGVALPLALFRYGVGERTEVRATWNGGVLGDGRGGTAGGAVEIKQTLTDGERVQTGLLLGVAIPSGGGPLDPSAGFLWSASVTDALSVFGTATAGPAAQADGERRWTATNAVGLGFSLSGQVGLFAEHFVSATEGEGEQAHVVDGGVTWLVTDDLQLDLTGGVSVGEADVGSFLGGGLAYRF